MANRPASISGWTSSITTRLLPSMCFKSTCFSSVAMKVPESGNGRMRTVPKRRPPSCDGGQRNGRQVFLELDAQNADEVSVWRVPIGKAVAQSRRFAEQLWAGEVDRIVHVATKERVRLREKVVRVHTHGQ